MLIFKKVDDLTDWWDVQIRAGRTIGFVPTMGALHQGHLSLVKRASKVCDLVVCSIFVNPAQFNDPKDFEAYPQPIERDIQQLLDSKCEVLFLPSVNEMYPSDLPDYPKMRLGNLALTLEGKFRPGHFDGMVKAVERLLRIVRPHHLFMGRKDYQQALIVGKLIEKRKFNIQLHTCPTERNAGGLALSSRNVRLSLNGQIKALKIPQTLAGLRKKISAEGKLNAARAAVLLDPYVQQFAYEKDFKLEYLEIRRADDLEELDNHSVPAAKLVILIAVWLEGIRLIDNMPVDPKA